MSQYRLQDEGPWNQTPEDAVAWQEANQSSAFAAAGFLPIPGLQQANWARMAARTMPYINKAGNALMSGIGRVGKALRGSKKMSTAEKLDAMRLTRAQRTGRGMPPIKAFDYDKQKAMLGPRIPDANPMWDWPVNVQNMAQAALDKKHLAHEFLTTGGKSLEWARRGGSKKVSQSLADYGGAGSMLKPTAPVIAGMVQTGVPFTIGGAGLFWAGSYLQQTGQNAKRYYLDRKYPEQAGSEELYSTWDYHGQNAEARYTANVQAELYNSVDMVTGEIKNANRYNDAQNVIDAVGPAQFVGMSKTADRTLTWQERKYDQDPTVQSEGRVYPSMTFSETYNRMKSHRDMDELTHMFNPDNPTFMYDANAYKTKYGEQAYNTRIAGIQDALGNMNRMATRSGAEYQHVYGSATPQQWYKRLWETPFGVKQ